MNLDQLAHPQIVATLSRQLHNLRVNNRIASNWNENAGGVPAGSRGLRSTATIPPVTRFKTACTLEGCQNGPVVLRRRRPLFAPWSKGVTVSLPSPSHHITGLQPGNCPGLKATHVIAWAGASPASAGPGSSPPTNLPSPVGAAHVPPNPSRISLTTSRPSPGLTGRRMGCFILFSWGVTSWGCTPSYHITGLQPGNFAGLKATHVIAWAGASSTSAGPGGLGSSSPMNLPSPVGAAHVPPNPSRISLTTSRPSPGLTGRRMGCFILFSWGVTSWGCTPSYHITGLQPGNFPGLKATHVIAWAGASSASAGPGGLGSSSPMNLPSPVGAAHGGPGPSRISAAGGFPVARRGHRRPRPGGNFSYPSRMLRTEARA